MTEKNKLRILRIICWVGITADALWSVALAFPQLYGLLIGRPHLEPDLAFRLTMGIGASLMMGWTLLLAWTAINPVERRAVLLLTAFPVLLGLTIVSAIGLIDGNTVNIWIIVKCALLMTAMLTGYHVANSIAKTA